MGETVVKNPSANAGDKTREMNHRRPGFDLWVGKIPWGRERQPTSVFLPGKSHGQTSLVGYSLWGHKESDMTERMRMHTHSHTHTLLLNRCASLLICVPSICSPPFPTCFCPGQGKLTYRGCIKRSLSLWFCLDSVHGEPQHESAQRKDDEVRGQFISLVPSLCGVASGCLCLLIKVISPL